jgi:hypothetical protein
MPNSRRTLLKGIGLSLFSGLRKPMAARPVDSTENSGPVPQEKESLGPLPPFASLREALTAPTSNCFGITAEGQSKHRESYYKVSGEDADHLSFDIANNQILCNLSRSGLPREACIATGLLPIDLPDSGRLPLPGVRPSKVLIRGGPWAFGIRLGRAKPMNLDTLPGVSVDLLGNLFPLFASHYQNLGLKFLAFAPAAQTSAAPPRAIIIVIQIQNDGPQGVTGAVVAPTNIRPLSELDNAPSEEVHEAVTYLDGTTRQTHFPEVNLTLNAGEQEAFTFALLLGENKQELKQTERVLREQPVLNWLNHTWLYHASRLGRLSIPESPFFAEFQTRQEEVCRQTQMHMGDGAFGGSFFGSNIIQETNIWSKDCFHVVFPMSLFEPELCAKAIPFFFEWGIPSRAYGRGTFRLPGAQPVTHSLSAALSPLVLAGAYYQMTGDQSFFLKHPEILASGRELLQKVMNSRRQHAFLFPSMYICDGDARGDFHTGSNVQAWYAFHSMARLARDVYHDPHAADQWNLIAERIKEDVLNYCIGVGPLGKQYWEGATYDRTFIVGHCGESSDASLMPFYGFCEADDPALIAHSRLGLSPQNPYYAPGIDGIWWYDGDATWQPATFPGWTSGLTGASNETELRERLEQIRRLADVDGSIWWWPYQYGAKDPRQVERMLIPGKCGWASGVYLCLFINNILGLKLDMPEHRIAFRPFCPWNKFTWEGCRLGRGLFDVAYDRASDRISAKLTNRNAVPFEATFELTLPEGATDPHCKVSGQETDRFKLTKHYNRPSVQVVSSVAPNHAQLFEVNYENISPRKS